MSSNVVGLDDLPKPGTEPVSASLFQFSFTQFYAQIPLASKILALFMVVLYLIGILIDSTQSVSLFGLTYFSFFYRPWTLVTAAFYHTSLIDMITNVAIVVIGGKYLETLWGTREYIKFILLIGTLATCASAITYILMYYMFVGQSLSHCGGFGGVIAGFAIAGRQLSPEHEVTMFLFFKTRLKNICLILLVSSLVFSFIGVPGTPFFFILYGTVFSWVYIRFYQNIEGRVGDRSEAMSFINFFPEKIQPVIEPALNKASIPFSYFMSHTESSDQDSGSQIGGLGYMGHHQDEIEKRRQRALKEVDEKLLHIKKSNTNIQEVKLDESN